MYTPILQIGLIHPALGTVFGFVLGICLAYFVYLVVLYLMVDRHRLIFSLSIAVLCWLVVAALLVIAWNKM